STEEARHRALSSGALAFLPKPIQSRDTLDNMLDGLHDFINITRKNLLLVEEDTERRHRLLQWLADEDVQVTTATDAQAGLKMLLESRVDCLVLGVQAANLLDGLAEPSSDGAVRRLPVIVYSDGELALEEARWKRAAQHCTLRWAHSPER